MKVSDVGRHLIEKYEGCVLHTYFDVVGVATIGYGCTGPEAKLGRVITQAQADQMLSDRLANEFEPAVINLTKTVPPTQGQFDAMVSLAFNVGTGGLGHSSVLTKHLARDWKGAAAAFALWNKAGGRVLDGLVRRRVDEAKMYLAASGGQGDMQGGVVPPRRSARDRFKAIQVILAEGGEYTGAIDGLTGRLSAAAFDALGEAAADERG